ncbi:hypothetical protein ACLOJK_015999 [Asimina triloba]
MGPTSGNAETEQRREDDECQDVIFKKRGCCFWIPYFGSSQSPAGGASWERIDGGAESEPKNKEKTRWWKDAAKKVREWSEVVAGPRWKTLVRRFNKKVSRSMKRKRKFQYDPMSYAMNFDGSFDADGENGHRSFSVRYATLPASAKSSMDFGRDGPDFSAMVSPSADMVAAKVRHG